MKNVGIRKRGAIFFAAVALGFLLMSWVPSEATQILLPGSIWEYTFTNPTADPDWNRITGGWSIGLAPFGNNTGGYSSDPGRFFDYKTYWAADGTDGDDLWVRIAVDLSGYDPSSLHWNLGVDNGFKLYANGALVAGANGEGYTFRWEYSGSFAGVALNPGINVVAVALEDHGGLTAFDMEITGTPVPEPATLLLLGSGLAGIGFFARRKRDN